jgi:hypothetical protein
MSSLASKQKYENENSPSGISHTSSSASSFCSGIPVQKILKAREK